MIHLVASSNGLKGSYLSDVIRLTEELEGEGYDVTRARHLFAPSPGEPAAPAAERAGEIAAALEQGRLVIDLSGGNRANEILPDLARELPGGGMPAVMGYSDLTAVLLTVCPTRPAILYQPRHILRGGRKREFFDLLGGTGLDLLQPELEPVRAPSKPIEGVLTGGNTRVLLKLAGTPYFPELAGRILLLEGQSSEPATLIPQLAQLSQMGALDEPRALVIGTFTTFEAHHSAEELLDLVATYARGDMPIFRTPQIGHAIDARGCALGARYRLGDRCELLEDISLWR